MSRFFGHRVGEYGDLDIVDLDARKITLAARMENAGLVERGHRRRSPLLSEVARMIVGETQDVEAGIEIVCCISCWGAEQIARARVLTFFCRLAAVNENALEIAKGQVGGR